MAKKQEKKKEDVGETLGEVFVFLGTFLSGALTALIAIDVFYLRSPAAMGKCGSEMSSANAAFITAGVVVLTVFTLLGAYAKPLYDSCTARREPESGYDEVVDCV